MVSHLAVVPQSFSLILALRASEQMQCMRVGSEWDELFGGSKYVRMY